MGRGPRVQGWGRRRRGRVGGCEKKRHVLKMLSVVSVLASVLMCVTVQDGGPVGFRPQQFLREQSAQNGLDVLDHL